MKCTGIRRMIDECRKAGLPEPQFESRGDSFRAVFRKAVPVEEQFAEIGLNERQLMGLKHLQREGRITKQQYRRITSATEVTAKRDLAELVNRGILARKGAT